MNDEYASAGAEAVSAPATSAAGGRTSIRARKYAGKSDALITTTPMYFAAE